MGLAGLHALSLNGAQMHFFHDIQARQIIWTLNFAGQLVLLVVLLGRDRVRRFPLFTASMVLFALRLLAEELLATRLVPLIYQQIILAFGDAGVILGLLVLAELAWRGFREAKRSVAAINLVGVLIVAGGLLAMSRPWPALKDLDPSMLYGRLRLMQFAAIKGDMLVGLLTVELGLLIVIFGRYFKAGWRSHVQQISIGLSTVAIAQLAIQTAVQSIFNAAHFNHPDQAEAQRLIALINKLADADRLIYFAAVLWWIVWLWLDEPGTPKASDSESAVEAESPAK